MDGSVKKEGKEDAHTLANEARSASEYLRGRLAGGRPSSSSGSWGYGEVDAGGGGGSSTSTKPLRTGEGCCMATSPSGSSGWPFAGKVVSASGTGAGAGAGDGRFGASISSTTAEDVSVIRTSSERSPCAGCGCSRPLRSEDSTYGPVSAPGMLMAMESVGGRALASWGTVGAVCERESVAFMKARDA